MFAAEKHGVDLLLFLHAIILSDSGAPGFTGRVSIGVEDESGSGTTWWNASFAAAGAAVLSETPATDADVHVSLTAAQANSWLAGTQDAKSSPGRVYGDREVLGRFLARYFQSRSMLDVRLGR